MKVADRLYGGFYVLTLLLAGLAFAMVTHATEVATTAQVIKRGSVATDDKWGGVVLPQPQLSGHFNAVQAKFTVPKISVPDGGSSNLTWDAAVQVGFGGTSNDNNNYWIQVGVFSSIKPSGVVTHTAFHAWYPMSDPVFDDSGLVICEGDELTLRINAYSNNSGVAIVENHTTGKGTHKVLEAPPNAQPILGNHAEWFVSEPTVNQLANFGAVRFSDAVAYTIGNQNFGCGHPGALIATVRDNGTPMTETILGSQELAVFYNPSNETRHVHQKRITDSVRPGGSAGAKFAEPLEQGKYRAVQGTVVMPALYIPADSDLNSNSDSNFTVIIAVQIGGSAATDDDPTSTLGVNLIINSQGNHSVWYQPFFRMGGVDHPFDDLDVQEGDILTLRLDLQNDEGTAGRGTITKAGNLQANRESKTVAATLGSTQADLGYHAEWVVKDPIDRASNLPLPLANFGTVEFTNASVQLHGDEFTSFRPGSANTAKVVVTENIRTRQGFNVTEVLVSPASVKVWYQPQAPF